MPFADACKDALINPKNAKEKNAHWHFIRNISQEELLWHLNRLTKEGLNAENCALILSIALCSISTWGKMATAIPWLGRYSQRRGVGHRVTHYFCEQTPVFVNENTLKGTIFARTLNGRIHGLRAVVPSNRFVFSHQGDVTPPWEFQPRYSTPHGGIEMAIWDRGRAVHTDIGFDKFTHGSVPTGYKYYLTLLWSGPRPSGCVKSISPSQSFISGMLTSGRGTP